VEELQRWGMLELLERSCEPISAKSRVELSNKITSIATETVILGTNNKSKSRITCVHLASFEFLHLLLS
jgi:hypothetical protein